MTAKSAVPGFFRDASMSRHETPLDIANSQISALGTAKPTAASEPTKTLTT